MKTYKLKPDMYMNNIEGQGIVMDSSNDKMYYLNETAYTILQCIQEENGSNEESILTNLLNNFEIDDKDLVSVKDDISEAIDNLLKLGIISVA